MKGFFRDGVSVIHTPTYQFWVQHLNQIRLFNRFLTFNDFLASVNKFLIFFRLRFYQEFVIATIVVFILSEVESEKVKSVCDVDNFSFFFR